MKNIFKKNYKFVILLISILLLFSIQFPYYIDAPGGISNMEDKIELDGYKSGGSLNLVYVKEYKATIPTLIFSLFNKDWNILNKEDVLLETENYDTYLKRDTLLMEESISNSIYVAFTSALKSIKIISNKITVAYIVNNKDNNLEVSDQIVSIDNFHVNSKSDIENIINSKNVGDLINIKVINNNKTYNRFAKIIDEDGSKKIGILVCEIKEYETIPSVKIKVDKNESGSSGGFITALSIYNSLTKDDITNNLTIVGTGTIDLDGNVGSIGGVEYKLKSAVKNKADLFLVPIGENYDEAIKLKSKNNYDIEIFGVSTFSEAINYLKNMR